MNAEIISIGDELTSGQRLDTNSQWLSQRLGEMGIAVRYHTTVADDLEANVGAFRLAAGRADIVVATGGLGPTADDLTREALAGMLGVELELNQSELDHIRSLFAHRKREMPERNMVQAMFPAGSRVIANPHGTAPGIDMIVPPPLGRPSRIFALPGVPAEMKEMWQATVAPRLLEQGAGGQVIRHRRIKCFGVGESDLEGMLPDLIRRGRVPSVGITVSEATITLRITASGRTPEECLTAMTPTEITIRQCLGALVFGDEEDELPDAIVRLLAERGETLATVEWGTAGLLAHWLGDVIGGGEVFRAGLIVRDGTALNNLLHVGEKVVERHAVAGGELAAAMASAAREQTGTDYGLAIGPLPPLEPAATEPAVYYFALASRDGVVTRSSPFAVHPAIVKPRAGKQALNLLRLQLLGSSSA
ncbi:MAG TPA: CinA family nicotinamide mononucleotide deamidase-related protein [Pirellulales bacterium]